MLMFSSRRLKLNWLRIRCASLLLARANLWTHIVGWVHTYVWMPRNTSDDKSGNKPLPEPMMTQIHVVMSHPQNDFDDKSTLVQVMAWCRQATSHYLSQWWPRYISLCRIPKMNKLCPRGVAWVGRSAIHWFPCEKRVRFLTVIRHYITDKVSNGKIGLGQSLALIHGWGI